MQKVFGIAYACMKTKTELPRILFLFMRKYDNSVLLIKLYQHGMCIAILCHLLAVA